MKGGRHLEETSTKIKKKAFLDAMVKTYGNVTASCKIVGISRQTYYLWIEKDAEFKLALSHEEFQERFLDMIEFQLAKKAQEGDTTTLIFLAKTKGRKRGFSEREPNALPENNLTIIMPNMTSFMEEVKKEIEPSILESYINNVN